MMLYLMLGSLGFQCRCHQYWLVRLIVINSDLSRVQVGRFHASVMVALA